jgi:hypothetical protein
MPLSFLNPAMLAGLLAAAVPVLIHFLSRRRARRVAFSDLRFLRDEDAQQAQRRGIQRWLLLLLRVLIVVCLALAAARPHWGGLPGGGGGSVVFVIDASASMQAQGDEGATRFAEAVELVGDMIGTLPPSSSVQVVLAGAGAEPLFAAWLPAGPAARAALVGARVTDGDGDLAAALRECARQARSASTRPVDVVIVSDLQAVPRPDLDAAAAELADAGGRVLVRPVGDGIPGGGVLDVALPARALRPGEAVEVAAVVRPERRDQVFWLEIDGRRVAETLAPAGEGPLRLTFPLSVPAAGLHAGRVGKDADRLPVDDVRPFVFAVPEGLDVLIAHGADRDGLGRGGWRFLASALDPAGAGAGPFRVRAAALDSLTDGDLAGSDLVVLVDVSSPGRRLADALTRRLESGGGLLVVAGDPLRVQDLDASLLPMLGLPAGADWVARQPDQAERTRLVDPGHPLLAGLGEPALEALGAVRWWRHAVVPEGDAAVILATDAGAPLLLEGRRGEGSWALLAGHLRDDATDFMLNPVFLPLMQRLAARLAVSGQPTAVAPVGEPPAVRLPATRLDLRPGERTDRLTVRTPPDGRPRTADLDWQAAGPVLRSPDLGRAGVYAFEVADDTLGLAAAVVPAAESEPRVDDVTGLAVPLRAAGLDRVLDLGSSDASGLGRALGGRDLTRWLLAAALTLMALELWLGRRVRT